MRKGDKVLSDKTNEAKTLQRLVLEKNRQIEQWEDMVYGLLQEWNLTFNHNYDITAFIRWRKANKMLPKHKRVAPIKKVEL